MHELRRGKTIQRSSILLQFCFFLRQILIDESTVDEDGGIIYLESFTRKHSVPWHLVRDVRLLHIQVEVHSVNGSKRMHVDDVKSCLYPWWRLIDGLGFKQP